MMNVRNKIAAATLLCAVVLLLPACKKEPNGVFTIKGKMLDSCGGSPIQNAEVVVSYWKHATTKTIRHDNIGTGTTDANGNFEVICQNWGDGNIEFRIKSGTNFSFYSYGEVNRVYDLATLYRYSKFTAEVKLNFSGAPLQKRIHCILPIIQVLKSSIPLMVFPVKK